MTRNKIEKQKPERWIQSVLEELSTRGYFYDPGFCTNVDSVDAVSMATAFLGSPFVPGNSDVDRPYIMTRPSRRAPRWRPFDRGESIGWHNDFSTWKERPELSLSWIRREDPSGPWVGAWRVASARAIVNRLCESADGRSLMARLANETYPFGYMDSKNAKFFRIIDEGRLRFYWRSLRDGAVLQFGKVPDHTQETIALIEGAADAVGETFPASKGALLIVHNWFSLHDRTAQTVEGREERRQAHLSFVRNLHRSLSSLGDRSMRAACE